MSALFDADTFEPTVGMSRATDPETSGEAAVIAIGNAAHGRRAVLRQLLAAGPDGLTDFELAERTGVQQTSIGKRRGELRDIGLVTRAFHEDGKRITRPSPTNSPSIVWILTAAGIAEAEALS